MATANKSDKGTDVMAPVQATEELNEIAESIFIELLKTCRDGKQYPALAHEAFKSASAFLEVKARINDGDLTCEPDKPDVPEYIEIPVMIEKKDNEWVPLRDIATGKTIMERAPVDRDAYAPNLPATHPINLRCKPRDGVSVEERIARHNAEKVIAAVIREKEDDARRLAALRH
jgi:hypothetical protein